MDEIPCRHDGSLPLRSMLDKRGRPSIVHLLSLIKEGHARCGKVRHHIAEDFRAGSSCTLPTAEGKHQGVDEGKDDLSADRLIKWQDAGEYWAWQHLFRRRST